MSEVSRVSVEEISCVSMPAISCEDVKEVIGKEDGGRMSHMRFCAAHCARMRYL
jgi:hypothetical protein